MPPEKIFGPEPAHGWCFYYQKASLARQRGDWSEIGRLYDETVNQNLRATDKSEVFPFLEGLVNLGRYRDARELVEKQIRGREKLSYELCESLSEDPEYPPEFEYNYEMLNTILCTETE